MLKTSASDIQGKKCAAVHDTKYDFERNPEVHLNGLWCVLILSQPFLKKLQACSQPFYLFAMGYKVHIV